MSLGKDSITKRVAKPAEAPKAPAKKAAKPQAPKAAVITSIAPETVEKVIQKPEGEVQKVSLGEAMPYYLL